MQTGCKMSLFYLLKVYFSAQRVQTKRLPREALRSKRTVNFEQSISKATGQSLAREMTAARRLVCIDTTVSTRLSDLKESPCNTFIQRQHWKGKLVSEKDLAAAWLFPFHFCLPWKIDHISLKAGSERNGCPVLTKTCCFKICPKRC